MAEQDNDGIFSRLKNLFSTDVIIRNIGGKQLKVIDFNRFQQLGNMKTNSLVDKYTRLHRFAAGAGGSYSAANYETMRTQIYADYEAMDTESIIASTLDIMADECTLKNEAGEVLQIRSADENIQRILYNLFYDVLNIEFNLWLWIRSMCKYGDFYLHLEIAEKFGIYNVTPLSAYDVIRQEGKDPQDPSRVTFKIDPASVANGGYSPGYGKDVLENFEISHFRLLTDSNLLPYGRSFIEPARKTYKQYVLMKDAMLLHRIVRAPEKRINYINVGSIPPNEVDAYMQKLMNKMKKTPFVDPSTGEYNLRYNVQNMMEDIYVPIRGNDQSTKIDTLKGLEYNAIEDVHFLRDELLSALKVPKAYFGFEKDLSGKATLAAEDIRFARTVERIQRIILSELYQMALTHLYVQGYDGASLTNFELTLTTPSIIYEQEKIALYKEKMGLAKDMLESKIIPSDFIYDNIFKFSDDNIEEYRDLVIEDQKRNFRLSQIENEGNDPAQSGKSFGTPHDLATLYGAGRMGQAGDVPDGYDEKEPVGRPETKDSIYGSQESNLGKDPIGKKAHNISHDLVSKGDETGTAKGNILSIGVNEYLKHKAKILAIPKKEMVFSKPIRNSLLSEINGGNPED